MNNETTVTQNFISDLNNPNPLISDEVYLNSIPNSDLNPNLTINPIRIRT